ncbi:major facilitator superfamily protein [Nitratireductor indicus C115]|uniref:Major facilitator superfamily protein n=1 Tax=Nitratireductor indicus C115 TaxID=1231190 RepID=K2N7Q9_9HYPH|nr:MFS transporter [Nitratireductor indicus]EKF43508.1 major facilitator superfamily protein [Nitratireductor indicus C115]SFQ06105.1 Predicted arabinose efflux permease, MFS family [Nitratireductor indicus]
MDKRLSLLALGAFAVSTVAFVFAGLLPLISDETGVTVAEAGYLVSAYSMAYALGTPVLSALTGGMNRRRAIALALSFFVLGNLVAALSGGFLPLFGAQVIIGLAGGLFAATAQAAAVTLAGPERRAAAISVVVGGTTFALAFGAPAGSFLAHMVGWRGAFVMLAVVGFFCLSALWIWLPRTIEGTHIPLSERVLVVRRPGILLSLAVSVLYLTGGFAVIAYLGPIATQGVGLSPDYLPMVLLAYGLGAILGNYASGRLADRLGASRVVVGSMLLAALFSLGFSVLMRFAPVNIAGPLLFALIVPWGFVGWTFPPAQASRLAGFAPDVAGLALALNASAIYLGVALGTMVGGRVLEYADVSDLGIAGAAFPLVALMLMHLARRESRRVALMG